MRRYVIPRPPTGWLRVFADHNRVEVTANSRGNAKLNIFDSSSLTARAEAGAFTPSV
jgi:hypothetical protein